MNRENYQKEMEQVLKREEMAGNIPRLLIHSCCAPCSSYVLEYLSGYFSITVNYYNPNIYPPEEYEKRVEEQDRLIRQMQPVHPITMTAEAYHPDEFYRAVKGYEKEPEGQKRCLICYELRLRKTAETAKAGKFDYFTTTLTISPLKRADSLNEIGRRLGKEYGVLWLPSDFKKKDGYRRSVELSEIYGLYRQDYCGCVYSMNARNLQQEK